MSSTQHEKRTVVIIGAGASGLTLANILHRQDIDCVVLEQQSLSHIEQRQRAGTVEARAVSMFERWGLGEVVRLGAPYDGLSEFRLDGKRHVFDESMAHAANMPSMRMCPQQVLVRMLISAFEEAGGDLRFDSADVKLVDLESDRPVVLYVDVHGIQHELACDFITGCDGFHGISRKSIPGKVLKSTTHDYGLAWLNVLAEVPPRIVMAMSDSGFAAQFPRGALSRFYLQCPITDKESDWPDERIWQELRDRLGEPDLVSGTITDRLVFPLRSAVFEPMSYGNLYLVGDAAHTISPVGGKGMNLALFDADTLALALIEMIKSGKDSGLRTYSDTCLSRTWNYQEFSSSLVEMLHNAGNTAPSGAFLRQLARARFKRMLTSPSAAANYSELMAGLA